MGYDYISNARVLYLIKGKGRAPSSLARNFEEKITGPVKALNPIMQTRNNDRAGNREREKTVKIGRKCQGVDGAKAIQICNKV